MLTVFYTAFSPACFSLLALWLAIIGFNARTWLNSQHRDHRQRQAYIVALYFAAPGTMSLLALIDPQSSFVWRVFFIIVSVLGVAGMLLFGSFPKQPDHLLDVSDHVVHWIAIGLYLAIAALAFSPLQTLRVEGVLLTVLVLLGVHVALRLMFAIGAPSPETSESALAVNTSSAPRAGPILSREHARQAKAQSPCCCGHFGAIVVAPYPGAPGWRMTVVRDFRCAT